MKIMAVILWWARDKSGGGQASCGHGAVRVMTAVAGTVMVVALVVVAEVAAVETVETMDAVSVLDSPLRESVPRKT